IITIVEDEDDYIKYIIKNLDKELTEERAKSFFTELFNKGYMNENELGIAVYAILDKSLMNVEKNKRNLVRHDIVKNILLSFLIRS
ncbi:MAG: CtsR family transcriptional regulator, partial [Anaerococcus obesiensis]